MKNGIRLFLIIIYVLLLESFILSCILTPILLIPSHNYLHDFPVAFFVFFALFFGYKFLLESWVYFVAINVYAHFTSKLISTNTLVVSRLLLMLIVTVIAFITLIFEGNTVIEIIGGTFLAPVIYIFHAAIPYFIFKKHLKRILSKHYITHTHINSLNLTDAEKAPSS